MGPALVPHPGGSGHIRKSRADEQEGWVNFVMREDAGLQASTQKINPGCSAGEAPNGNNDHILPAQGLPPQVHLITGNAQAKVNQRHSPDADVLLG